MDPTVCPADPNASAAAYMENRMLPSEIREFEQHLASCPKCAGIAEHVRAFLAVSAVHQTEDGPVHLWASRDEDRGWKARNWGPQLAGLRRFSTLAEANQYLRESFIQMFPGHACGGECEHLDDAAQKSAAARMQYWDYSE